MSGMLSQVVVAAQVEPECSTTHHHFYLPSFCFPFPILDAPLCVVRRLIPAFLSITIPGRLAASHCTPPPKADSLLCAGGSSSEGGRVFFGEMEDGMQSAPLGKVSV